MTTNMIVQTRTGTNFQTPFEKKRKASQEDVLLLLIEDGTFHCRLCSTSTADTGIKSIAMRGLSELHSPLFCN